MSDAKPFAPTQGKSQTCPYNPTTTYVGVGGEPSRIERTVVGFNYHYYDPVALKWPVPLGEISSYANNPSR